MGGSIRIGTLLGIPIALNVSWFVALWLLSWSLAVAYYPARFPGLESGTYWAMGITSTLLLFGSVLVHEFGHALTARRFGIRTRSITLFLFGGVAQIAKEPPTPRVEGWVAIAGPLTSYTLAAVFWTLSLPLVGSALGSMVGYLALINVILATFNLLPGFPLDGGRVLRAIVWSRTGSLERATRVASRSGKIVAALLIVLGLVQVFAGQFVAGIWLIFIGWFLDSSAEAGYQQVLLRAALRPIRVRDIMTRQVHTIDPNLTVEEAIAEYFIPYKHGGFPVVYGERLVGVITMEDIRKVPREERAQRRVRDIMTPQSALRTVRPETDTYEAFMRMAQDNVGRLPVIDQEGQLVGIVTRTDLMHLIRLHTELGEDLEGLRRAG